MLSLWWCPGNQQSRTGQREEGSLAIHSQRSAGKNNREKYEGEVSLDHQYCSHRDVKKFIMDQIFMLGKEAELNYYEEVKEIYLHPNLF